MGASCVRCGCGYMRGGFKFCSLPMRLVMRGIFRTLRTKTRGQVAGRLYSFHIENDEDKCLCERGYCGIVVYVWSTSAPYEKTTEGCRSNLEIGTSRLGFCLYTWIRLRTRIARSHCATCATIRRHAGRKNA